MIHRSQFQTATRAIQLGNAVSYIKNQRTQLMGLTSTQSEAIRYILKNYREKPLSAANLMEYLQLSQSTVAGIIQRLEQKELIERTVSEADARKSIIKPTTKGLELEEALKQSAVETEALLLNGMTREEQEQFNYLLQKALDNMNAAKVVEKGSGKNDN